MILGWHRDPHDVTAIVYTINDVEVGRNRMGLLAMIDTLRHSSADVVLILHSSPETAPLDSEVIETKVGEVDGREQVIKVIPPGDHSLQREFDDLISKKRGVVFAAYPRGSRNFVFVFGSPTSYGFQVSGRPATEREAIRAFYQARAEHGELYVVLDEYPHGPSTPDPVAWHRVLENVTLDLQEEKALHYLIVY